MFGVLGIVLAATPGTAVRMWPWALTAVLARTYAAIFLAFALGAALAADESRPAAVRPFALSSLVLVAVDRRGVARAPRQVRRRPVHLGLGGRARRRPGRVRRGQRRVAAGRLEAGVTPTLRPYLALLGATLLGQGLVSLALDWSGHASNQLPNRFANSDPAPRGHPRRLGRRHARAGRAGDGRAGLRQAGARLRRLLHRPRGARRGRAPSVRAAARPGRERLPLHRRPDHARARRRSRCRLQQRLPA